MIVTEPGLVFDMDDETYHGDPIAGGSLSSTFARLLTEHVPAKALELRKRPPTKAMSFGTQAHRIILGQDSLSDYATSGMVVIEGDGRTKAVKEARAAAVAAGKTVVSAAEYDSRQELHQKLHDMAAASYLDPRIYPLLKGKKEVSAFWRDAETGVWLRCRFDVLPDASPFMVAYDYKTTIDASRRGFQKSIARYGYHQQAEFYLRALRALGIAKAPKFRFIAQETQPPYLVNVHECDDEAMDAARVLNDRAIRIYAECKSDDIWPGYEIDLEPLPLPSYYFYDHEEALGLNLGEEMVI